MMRAFQVTSANEAAAGHSAWIWIDRLSAMRFVPFKGALLVGSDQPGVARHIGGEDRGEAA
jgi:hypothetical protein